VRCVFDTNIFISALLSPESKPRRALDTARQNGPILISFAVLAELYDVLNRKQFRRYISDEEVRLWNFWDPLALLECKRRAKGAA